jgi:hypothetical protein
MSGVSMLSVEMVNLEAGPGNYRMVTFPNRVRLTSVGFTVNDIAVGDYEDERVWKIYCMVGHPNPEEGSPWGEYIHPIFGLSEKPTVTNVRKYTSSFMENVSQIISNPRGKYENLDLDFGVIEPGGYLVFWIQNESGDIEGIDWALTQATVSIMYEETHKMTALEFVNKYPELA